MLPADVLDKVFALENLEAAGHGTRQADYNLGLSQKRALSIARRFRKMGFRYPIFYQGFGERGLKVPTPDETDEPRNRRAEYVLAAEPPPIDVPGAATRWKRL